jgi:hypothetical protein
MSDGRRTASSRALLRALVADPARALRWGVSTIGAFRRGGVSAVRSRLASGTGAYQQWIARYDTLGDDDRRAMAGSIAGFERTPVISIVMPVYDVEERWLRRAIDSVLAQSYPHWELCIADDASPSPHVRSVLDEYRSRDPRITVEYRATNGHISAASNSALALATGEFIALLDHDDELAPHALYLVADELQRHPDAALLYSDEDGVKPDGERFGPIFKPDFSPDLLLSVNAISHLGVYRTALVRELGGFRTGYDGSQDYDLALRVIERAGAAAVRHIPHVLYHWRAIPGSVLTGSGAKEYAHDAARRAIAEHLDRAGERAEVGEGFWRLHRVRFELPDPLPSVALLVVGGPSDSALTLSALRSSLWPGVRPVVCDDAASIERAIGEATEDVVVFVRAGLVAGDRTNGDAWLREIVAHALRRDVAAAGGRVVDAGGRIVAAGLALDASGRPVELYRGAAVDEPGQLYRAQVLGNYSGCSLALLGCRRAHLVEALAPSERAWLTDAASGDDVAAGMRLSLALCRHGRRIVWTPYSELLARTAPAPSTSDPIAPAGIVDPAFSPNLALDRSGRSLAFPPRVTRPWQRGSNADPEIV